MWTAANFIIEGRMRPYGRRLCTVGLVLVEGPALCEGNAMRMRKWHVTAP